MRLRNNSRKWPKICELLYKPTDTNHQKHSNIRGKSHGINHRSAKMSLQKSVNIF